MTGDARNSRIRAPVHPRTFAIPDPTRWAYGSAMFGQNSLLSLVILTAFGIAALNPALADEGKLPMPSDPRWRQVLKDQLKSEKNCDLTDVLTYSELQLGEGVAISGRISCLDGREYDFTRQQPHMKFEIKLCEPSVC